MMMIKGMSCPSWQSWHTSRNGYRWSPLRTLPVAPLWCDLGRCSLTVVVMKLLQTSAFKWFDAEHLPGRLWCKHQSLQNWANWARCQWTICADSLAQRPTVPLWGDKIHWTPGCSENLLIMQGLFSNCCSLLIWKPLLGPVCHKPKSCG